MLSTRNFGLRKIHLVMLALLLALPLTAAAQTTATIVGTITDSNNAILLGAKVTARNVDTGLTRTVSSGEDGAYRLEFLPVGNYEIEVTATGLKKTTRSGIWCRIQSPTGTVPTFETEYARLMGAKFCVATGSGTVRSVSRRSALSHCISERIASTVFQPGRCRRENISK